MVHVTATAGWTLTEVLDLPLDEFDFWCGEVDRYIERRNDAQNADD